MTRLVVGLEGLRLKGHKEGAVLSIRVGEDDAAVMIDAVVSGMSFVVALVHVDIVNSIAGNEFEVLVFLGLRTPPGAERIDDGAVLVHRIHYGAFHRVLEIVIDSRSVARHYLELRGVDKAAANK